MSNQSRYQNNTQHGKNINCGKSPSLVRIVVGVIELAGGSLEVYSYGAFHDGKCFFKIFKSAGLLGKIIIFWPY